MPTLSGLVVELIAVEHVAAKTLHAIRIDPELVLSIRPAPPMDQQTAQRALLRKQLQPGRADTRAPRARALATPGSSFRRRQCDSHSRWSNGQRREYNSTNCLGPPDRCLFPPQLPASADPNIHHS